MAASFRTGAQRVAGCRQQHCDEVAAIPTASEWSCGARDGTTRGVSQKGSVPFTPSRAQACWEPLSIAIHCRDHAWTAPAVLAAVNRD